MTSPATMRALAAIDLAKQQGATSLDLHAFGLKELPPLPPELRLLRVVNLSRNRLAGLASEFWQLAQIERLDLGGNRLVEIAPEIRNLTALRHLDVAENRLPVLAGEIGACVQLIELCAYGNQFSALPGEVAALPQLVRLDLSGNRLGQLRLPPGALRHLEELNLANNQLESLPRELGDLESLRVLNLSGNRLSSIDSLVSLAKLEELYVDDNLLTALPAKLAALSSLRVISAAGNRFDQMPAAFAKAGALELQVQAQAAVRKHTVGGPEPGKEYFVAAPYFLNLLLMVGGFTGVMKVVDLYYQRFRERISMSVKLPDGRTYEFQGLSRKAAIDIMRENEDSLAGKKAAFELKGAHESTQLQTASDLIAQAVSRVSEAELVPKNGQPIQLVNYNFFGSVQNSNFETNNQKEKIMGDKITTGDINDSNVNFKSTLKDVRQSVGAAKTVDQATKALLDDLLNQLSDRLDKLPPKKAADAEAVAAMAGDLVKKATAEKPNKKLVEISGKGLLEAAKAVASVVPIALKIVGTVAKFMAGV